MQLLPSLEVAGGTWSWLVLLLPSLEVAGSTWSWLVQPLPSLEVAGAALGLALLPLVVLVVKTGSLNSLFFFFFIKLSSSWLSNNARNACVREAGKRSNTSLKNRLVTGTTESVDALLLYFEGTVVETLISI